MGPKFANAIIGLLSDQMEFLFPPKLFIGRVIMGRVSTKFAEVKGQRQRDQLTQMWKSHRNHYTRIRAHAILLSGKGYDVNTLAAIFEVDRDSVSSWIDRFGVGGAEALEDPDRPGGPSLLDEQEQELLRDLFARYPSRPAKVLSELEKRTHKKISESTLRNYARRLNLVWKRFRRSLREKRDEKAFRQAQRKLQQLLDEPNVDVVYFDEAGFSLKGVVPYGWQPRGERLEVPVSGAHGSTIQALGFESQDGKTDMYLHKGYVNSEIVISVFDDYSQQIEHPTIVVLDNASCHTSAAFKASMDRWAKRGLLIYYLPAYSLELNAIELFWKKLKYQLLPATAWERFTSLLNTLTSTLCKIGEVSYLPSLRIYTE